MSKTFTAHKAVLLPKDDASFNRAIVRLNNSRIDASQTKKHLFWRHEPVLILNSQGARVLRSVMGTSGLIGITKDAIGLDYDARAALSVRGIDEIAECELTVRPAKFLEILSWYYSHTDTGYQVATKLGVLGAFLGFLGVVISVVGLLF